MQSRGGANRYSREDSDDRTVVEGRLGNRHFYPVNYARQAAIVGKNVERLEITVANHRSMRAAWFMNDEPIDRWTKTLEGELCGRCAQAGEIGVEVKITARQTGTLNARYEIGDRQRVQTCLRVLPKPQDLPANAR